MLLTKEATLKIRANTVGYYQEKGYDCKAGDTITIKIEDLQPKSDYLVTYTCDNPNCPDKGKKITIAYEFYTKKRKRVYAPMGDFCSKCSKWARKTWFEQNDPDAWKGQYRKARAKAKETLQELYGVDNPMQVPEFVENLKQSVQEKYGVENVMQLPETRAKIMKSMGSSQEVEQCTTPNGKVYYKFKSVPCSANQMAIWQLFGGKLNEFVEERYTVDILLSDKIYFEYDGTGHALEVKLGRISEKDFKRRETNRYYFLKSKGYKMIDFKSTTYNTLPDDEVLLGIKDYAIHFLSFSEHNWIEFDYDNKAIRTKFGKVGYDFSTPLKENDFLELWSEKNL